jgi:hypothetical protein
VRLSDERLAKNEAHFRKVNERLKEISTPWAKTTDYLCECSAATCIETIELTKEEYERARARPTTFLLIPGHERSDLERVVQRNEDFLLVEKVVAAEQMIEEDPRSE